jgi:hypothetical protein
MESMKICYNGDNFSIVTTTLAIYIAGVYNTGQQCIAGVIDTCDKHKIANISSNFCKNLKWPQ